MASRLILENQAIAEKAREGQRGKLMWFVGQMIRAGEGKVEAGKAEEVVMKLLMRDAGMGDQGRDVGNDVS